MTSRPGRILNSDAAHYLLALTPVVTIFFLIPFELYYNSREYWNWNRALPLSFVACGLLLYLVGVHLITVSLKIHRYFSLSLALFLFFWGVFVLLADVFSPLQASVLDGTEVKSAQPLKYSLREGIFLLGILAAAVLIKPRRLTSFAVPVSGGLLVIAVVYLGLILASGKPAVRGAVPKANLPPIKGNVYQIVLDEMQTDAALLFFEDEVTRRCFPGFTLFPFNLSNYLYTSSSVPSYFTGSLYREGSFERWQSRFREEGLLQDLYERGYRITMCAPRPHWRGPYLAEFKSLQDFYSEETRDEEAFFKDFTRIWLARITPNVFTNRALSLGQRLGERVYDLLKSQRAEKEYSAVKGLDGTWFPASIAEGREPFSSMLMLRWLIESEKNRAPVGEYVYAHAVLPHGPYVFNHRCGFDLNLRKTGASGYGAQVSCAFIMVLEFLEELQRLGRYDAATIVIHADSGHGLRGFIKKAGSEIVGTGGAAAPGEAFLGNSLNWSKDQVLSRTMALLMIKPAGSRGNLKYSSRLSQLVDLYPTLVDLLQLEPEGLKSDGLSLFREEPFLKRSASFFIYPPQDRNPEMIRIEVSDQKRPWDSPLVVTDYQGKPPAGEEYEGVVFR